jgi:DNA (cytosine-5)-methyltransferase 1
MLRGGANPNTRIEPKTASRRVLSRVSFDRDPYPVVDLFAGPGGLGEGFAVHADQRGSSRFRSAISIERDEFSHQTLTLRHFFRHFPTGHAPDDYYDFLKGGITREQLFARHKEAGREACNSALRVSLGPDSHSTVREMIQTRLSRAGKWALVGGPPCQAYSLVGRSRMSGREGFERDERHTLYLE